MDRLILNCDLGENESPEYTERLLELVDAANIGCGYHAGDPAKTSATIRRALAAGTLIGAHPGLASDGGRGQGLPSADAFRELLEIQISSFREAARSYGAELHYIKLHGTLYHAVENEPQLAAVYLDFLQAQPVPTAVFALAGGHFGCAAEAAGLRVYHEVFADRAYRSDGSLVPRSEVQSVLDTCSALARFRTWREQGTMPDISGGSIALKADTLCVHGDSAGALDMVRDLRKILYDDKT